MKYKVTNRHFIFFVLLLIIISRLARLSDIAVLFYSFFVTLFSDFSAALSQISFQVADNLLSVVLIIVFGLFLLVGRRKDSIFNKEIGFSSLIIILLLIFFIFAPVVSTTDPDFQNNIGVTKLLPPFSTVNYIQTERGNTGLDDFGNLKNQILNKDIIYADSVIKLGNDYYYYQKGKKVKAEKDKVQFDNDIPLVHSRLFVLGTDEFGRDVFSRLVYGTRISMIVGLGAVIVSFILGIGFGFLSGYSGRVVDTLLNRLTDTFLSVPVIFLVILILAFFGNSIFAIIVILGFSGWMSLFKIVRSEVISVKQKDYFITATKIGLPAWKLLVKEIMPVIIAPVIVNLVFQYGNVILAEAALSYLGLGTGLNYPSWGGMIEAGQEYLSQAWWMILFPGLALILTLFTANNLGRDLNRYYNPRISK